MQKAAGLQSLLLPNDSEERASLQPDLVGLMRDWQPTLGVETSAQS